MSLRIFSAITLSATLAACGANTSPEPEGAEVECAIGAGAELSPVCTLEVISDNEFVIHHPDGGFRRFLLNEVGRISLADGADQIWTSRSSDEGTPMIAITAASDQYQLQQDALPRLFDE